MWSNARVRSTSNCQLPKWTDANYLTSGSTEPSFTKTRPFAIMTKSPRRDDETSNVETKRRTETVPTTSTSSGVINSMWLNWKHPDAVIDLSHESENGSALEMRRQKNRESMRRSRQRQRDQLQLLRDAVVELEQQYQSLRLQSERLTHEEQTQGTCDRKYAHAIELSKQLGAENLYLKASIQYQASWKLELRRVMETTLALDEFTATASAPPSPFPFKLEMMHAQEAASVFGFHPLTERDVKDIILENTKTVQRVHHRLLGLHALHAHKSDSESVDDDVTDEMMGPIDHSELFGWDLRRRVQGSDMEFVFTKQFHNISVSEVMQKSWVNEMQLEGAQKVKYDIQRLEMLQEVNTNAYVLGRDVRSPDELPVFRTTLLRYRMETTGDVPFEDELGPLRATGYVIGTQSLNPAETSGAKLLPERAGIEPMAPLVWADLAHTLELLQVSDRTTQEEKYVQVRWSGINNYGSTFDAHRNAADMVTTLMRWELGTIAPAIQLIPSSDEPDPYSDENGRP